MVSSSSFTSLPDKILGCIRVSVAGHIASHIALSQTCRRWRDVYQEESCWQFACFKAGFGRPRRRRRYSAAGSHEGALRWRELAYLLVSHADQCEINSCKDANRHFARHYANSVRHSIRDPLSSTLAIEIHPLYFYLHFAHSPDGAPGTHTPLPDTFSILLTHLPTFPESKTSQYGPLCSHPNASCAFATFPPMESLSFEDANGDVFLSVENPDGCTILDVNRGFAELIPRDMTQLQIAMDHYRELILTSGLSSLQFAELIKRDRGFLGDHEYPFLQELMAQA
ncbi:hypothetical protein BC835DRAFT_1418580 [Cytidiella melzeri]|nr:hypothetical protein BC835DRAFT_1418580 [Cytidiella melzeri]